MTPESLRTLLDAHIAAYGVDTKLEIQPDSDDLPSSLPIQSIYETPRTFRINVHTPDNSGDNNLKVVQQIVESLSPTLILGILTKIDTHCPLEIIAKDIWSYLDEDFFLALLNPNDNDKSDVTQEKKG